MNYTSDIVDEYPEVDVIPIPFTDYGGKLGFEGVVETLQVNADNALVREALSRRVDGSVLFVDGGASFKTALLGGNLATLAENNGWSGLVIYGCIRDSHELKTVNIGCKALGSIPRKSAKAGSGKVNISVQVGGITVKPGSYVYCDLDGIVLASQRLF